MNVQVEETVQHSIRPAWGRQVRRAAPAAIGVALTTLAAGLLLVYAYVRRDVSPGVLITDPLVLAGGRHVGLFTTVGVLLWAATAAVLLYGAALVSRAGGRTRVPGYLLLLGLFTLLLCFDDFYAIHEDVGFALATMLDLTDSRRAIPLLEAPYFLLYIAFTGLLIHRFRTIIRRSAYLLLLAAGLCFAGSLAIDIGIHALPGTITDHPTRLAVMDVTEELLKLAGIQLWLAYAVSTVTTEVLRVFRPKPEVAPARD